MTTGFSINSAGSGQAEEKAPASQHHITLLPKLTTSSFVMSRGQGMRLKGMQLLLAKSACVLQHQGRAPQT